MNLTNFFSFQLAERDSSVNCCTTFSNQVSQSDRRFTPSLEKIILRFHHFRSMKGVSHGGGLTSHGTDAESFPSENDTDQLGQSMAVHMLDDGSFRLSMKIVFLRRTFHFLVEEQPILSLGGEPSESMLNLVETDTIFVLSIESSIVSNDSPDLEAVKQKNERFVEVNFSTKIFFVFLRTEILSKLFLQSNSAPKE